jgi:hypothetical protein
MFKAASEMRRLFLFIVFNALYDQLVKTLQPF